MRKKQIHFLQTLWQRYSTLRKPFRIAIPVFSTILVGALIFSLVFLSSPAGQAFASGVYTTSATDANGNTLLGSNTVNDTQAYDTTQDSSAATQQQLGIDPNWTNGVGNKGSALYTHGSDDYVSVANPANGALAFGTGSFSYGLWFKPITNVGAFDMPIFKGGASAASAGFDIELGTGQWATSIADGTSTVGASFYASSPAMNAWYHLFVVVDRDAQKLRTYVNGANISNVSIATIGSVTSSTDLNIGARSTSAFNPTNGDLDDVRIYSRALSADEVAKLAGKQPVSDANLAGWWKFDDLSGTTAIDSSPFANNGTLLNGVSNSPAADGTTNGPIWVSGSDAVMNGFKGCGPDDVGCTNPSGQIGAGNVSVTADSSTTSTNGYDLKMVNPPALTFDGDNSGNPDYVSFSNNTAADIGTGSMTWATRFKTTSSTLGVLYRKSNGSFANGFALVENGSGTLAALINGVSISTTSATALNNGIWHSAIVVYNRQSQTLRLFVDGVQTGSTADASSIGASNLQATSTFELAGTEGGCGSSCYFNGSLSDFRIWSRALSAQEISALYTNQPISNQGLAAWWKMNEGSGTTIKDYSGNGITGSLMNGASNSPAADGTANGPIWSEGPPPVSGQTGSATSSSPAWSLPNYSYRQQMNVANASGATLPAGYSVNSPVTWSSLLNQNQSRADNNDFRIFHQTTDAVRSLGFVSANGSKVTIPESPSLIMNTAVTLSAWVKYTVTGTFQRIIAKSLSGAGTTASTSYEMTLAPSNQFGCNINLGSSVVGPTARYVDGRATASVGPNAWHLLTCVYSGSAITNVTTPVYIGNVGNNNAAFDGSIDDARIYNTALTASQAQALYNGGVGTTGAVTSGLVGWYRLDEGSGQIVTDASGNNNNGMLGSTTGSDTTDPTWNSTAGSGTPDGVVSTSYEVPRYIPKASALTFDGAATSVAITNPAGDQVAMPSGTVSVWLNRSLEDGTLRTAYDLAGTGSNGATMFSSGVGPCASNTFRFQYGNGGGTTSICGPALTNGTWYQAVATWNSAGATLYLNGVKVGSSATVPSITVGTNSYIGSNGGSQRYMAGTIGETRLYNKTLSAAQVSQLYTNASTQAAAPNANMIEAWRADEGTGTTFNDASGIGANGTVTIGSGAWLLNQAVTPSTQQAYFQTVAPIANSASSSGYYLYYGNPTEQNTAMSSPQASRTGLYFDGASGSGQNDVVIIPHASSIDSQTTLTWSAWVKPASAGQAGAGRVFDKGQRQITIAGSPGSADVQFSQNFASGSNQWHTPVNSITYGSWAHIAVTYDASSTANAPVIYINGVLQTLTQTASSGSGSFASDSSSNLAIGNTNNSIRTYDGAIDDARVYNRILSSTEAADLYGSGNTPPVSNSGLVGWWKMDEATGSSALDASGNNNTGTLTNFNFNTTDGWTLNPNLWQTSSVTTNTTNLAPQTETPRYFAWRSQSNNTPTYGSWSAELPIAAGPTQLGATGVKVVFNPAGVYPHNDTYHIASWVVQAFSTGTEARGIRRTYPKVANIIANNGGIDIIDAATNLLWMRLAANGGSGQLGLGVIKVSMLNGRLYYLYTGGNQLREVDFPDDNFRKYSGVNYIGQETIANQLNGNTYLTGAGQGINTAVNFTGVSAGVEGTTPPRQFVALSGHNVQLILNETSSSYQSIIAADSPVYNYARTSGDTYGSVALASNGSLYGADTTAGGVDRWDSVQTASADVLGSTNATYTTSSTPALRSNTVNSLSVSVGTSSADYTSNTVAVGGPSGVDVVNEGSSPVINRYENTGSTGTSGWNSKGFGGAIELNGSSQFVSLGTGLNMDNSSAYTFEAWAKTSASVFQEIIDKRVGTAGDSWYRLALDASGHAIFELAANYGTNYAVATSAGTYNDGAWHHYAGVRLASGNIVLYVDGVQVATYTSPIFAVNDTNVVEIGGTAKAGGTFFNGQIDEVRISNNARYTSNFTPQSTEFTFDASTVGLWHFDEPNGQYVTDSSSNADTGTLGANSSVASDDPYLVSPSLDGAANVSAVGFKQANDQGKGLSFNGTSQYVSSSTKTPFNFADQSFTISAWVKETAGGAIIGADGATGGWYFSVALNSMSIVLKNAGSSILNGSKSATGVGNGNWHHVIAIITTSTTVNANNTVAFYMDGIPLGTATGATGTYAVPTVNMSIGARNNGGASPQLYSGTLDDIRVYNAALTPSNIMALYNGGRGWNGTAQAGLVAGYAMNEGSGQTVSDYSGNSYTGTLGATNAASTDDPTWTSGTAVRDQPVLVAGTNDNSSVGAVSIVSLTNNRQVKSYTTSNSLLPAYSVSSLSVGKSGLALVGTGSGAWNPGKEGVVNIDTTIGVIPEVVDTRLKTGTVRLKSGTIRL